MACTKQTARKSDKQGNLPSQSHGGHTLTTFANRQSPRFLDSNSDIERAPNMFGVNPHGSSSLGSSARGSPARGSKQPATPSSSDSSPCRSPHLSSPDRVSSARGIQGWGASRGTGRCVPVGIVNPQGNWRKARSSWIH